MVKSEWAIIDVFVSDQWVRKGWRGRGKKENGMEEWKIRGTKSPRGNSKLARYNPNMTPICDFRPRKRRKKRVREGGKEGAGRDTSTLRRRPRERGSSQGITKAGRHKHVVTATCRAREAERMRRTRGICRRLRVSGAHVIRLLLCAAFPDRFVLLRR